MKEADIYFTLEIIEGQLSNRQKASGWRHRCRA